MSLPHNAHFSWTLKRNSLKIGPDHFHFNLARFHVVPRTIILVHFLLEFSKEKVCFKSALSVFGPLPLLQQTRNALKRILKYKEVPFLAIQGTAGRLPLNLILQRKRMLFRVSGAVYQDKSCQTRSAPSQTSAGLMISGVTTEWERGNFLLYFRWTLTYVQ